MDTPLAILIKTASGCRYIYDGLTSKVLSLNEEVKTHYSSTYMIDCFSKYYNTPHDGFSGMEWCYSYDDYKGHLDSRIPNLLLQITASCNLACDYCIYSGNYSHMRSHSSDKMTEDLLFQSIDFFAKHNSLNPDARIDFYGGEALLCFDMIKKAVPYARHIFANKKLLFGISTNGVMLDDNTAEWLAENRDVTITVTVNGIDHDHHRTFSNKNGSLNIIMSNLERIRIMYPSVWKNQVRFISNIFSYIEIPELRDFYITKLHKMPIMITDVSTEYGNDIIIEMIKHDEKLARKISSFLQHEYYESADPFLSVFYERSMQEIHNRPIYDSKSSALMNSCLPGLIKIYVYTNGSIGFCESVCDKVNIGSIRDGLDDSKIHDLYIKTLEFFSKKCQFCWAQRLCHICIKDIIDQDGQIMERIPHLICEKSRQTIREQLKMYCEIFERNPERLSKLEYVECIE